MQAYWKEILQRVSTTVSWMEHTVYEERTRTGFVHPGEKRQRRDLMAICKYKVRGCRGDGARCFLERHTDSTRGNSH